VHFDNDHLMFFGHSQGGLKRAAVARDGRQPRGRGVLSGAGGAFNISLLLKTHPVNVPALITVLLQLEPHELVPLHPTISPLAVFSSTPPTR